MVLEALLTKLEIDSNKRVLVAGFRDLGEIYFPDWEHWFVAKLGKKKEKSSEEERLRNDNYKKLIRKINGNPLLRHRLQKLKDKYWYVLALKCPISLKDELPEEFIRGHYTQQARWRLCPPSNVIDISEKTYYALKERKEIQAIFDSLEEKVKEKSKKGHANRILRELDDLFYSYSGNNYLDLLILARNNSVLKNLGQDIFDFRKTISDRINNTNFILRNESEIVYTPKRNLIINQKDWNYLLSGKIPSAKNLLGRKWMFLDIEIPYFRRENPRITWVGVTYIEKGVMKREIHTVHDLGVGEIKGFKVLRYRDESELIDKLRESIKKENPDFVSTYNTRFDLIKLRESESGFDIGDMRTPPLFKVTTPFFERIGIRDKFVYDFLRWQKKARAYDPNAKLEMAAGFEKSISYEEMEKLEELSFSGGKIGKKAARDIASYLAGDMNNLTKLFFLEPWRTNFNDDLEICQGFGIGLERISHSGNCINDIQERGYFSALGIYREEVPPHQKTKKMQALRTKARTEFKETLDLSFEEKNGLFSEVYKVFIPYGDFFRDLLENRFQSFSKFWGAREFFDFKDKAKEDKKRLFYLEQYAKELARWMIEDEGAYLEEVSKLRVITHRIKREDLERVCKEFRRNLLKTSEWGVKHYDEGNLSARAFEKHTIPSLVEFLEKNHKTYRDFAVIANQRTRVKRKARNIIGNYNVFPIDERTESEKQNDERVIYALDETINARLDEIEKFISERNLEVICQEGTYLYVRGDKRALEERNCPVVLVDEILKLYNADRPYYQKFGYIHHMKSKEEPDVHLNVFEMTAFREMLQLLFENNFDKARQSYTKAFLTLNEGLVNPRELLFYNRSSGLYSAYLDGIKDKIFFVTDKKSLEVPGVSFLRDEIGEYFISEESDKVYVLNPEAIKLDIKQYQTRFADRARKILAPVASFGLNRTSSRKSNKNQLELAL